jgi:hypothetical protein
VTAHALSLFTYKIYPVKRQIAPIGHLVSTKQIRQVEGVPIEHRFWQSCMEEKAFDGFSGENG